MNKVDRYRRICISEEDKEIFDYLRSVEPFVNLQSAEIFALALIFGKKEGVRTPLNGKKVGIIAQPFINSNVLSLMKSISFEETGSFEVLGNKDEYFTICEEYAKTGFSLLDKAYLRDPNSILDVLEQEAMEYFNVIDKTI